MRKWVGHAIAALIAAALLAGCDMRTRNDARVGPPETANSSPRPLVTSPLPAIYSPDVGNPWSGLQYRNPIIFADYSDPDVCRAGDDFYMTASSFSCFPGLPILHSRDLVHWTIVGHAVTRYPAPWDKNFDTPAHGAGVWAPSIRFHAGWFWIFFGDPDLGVFMTKTKDPAGTWEPLVQVKQAKGWIDTCPLWDDDGQAYLVHAFANSRAGIANVLDVCRLSADGTRLLDEGTRIYDGGQTNPARPPAPAFANAPKYTTVEGPKFYKRNGFYYVMAPGGGVTAGYQIVFRSKTVTGPYDSRIVLDRGATSVNGPHQGGWVTSGSGASQEDWFIHFQEVLPYGRILHLQPVTWKDDWPVMGVDADGDGKGEPVPMHALPHVDMNTTTALPPELGGLRPLVKARVPQTSDEFDLPELGLQWQWWANFKPEWASLAAHPGYLRLVPVALDKPTLLYNRPNLLLQKFPAETFTVTVKLDVSGLRQGETAGLVLAGKTMSSLTCSRAPGAGVKITRTNFTAPNSGPVPANAADRDEASVQLTPPDGAPVYLRMRVAAKGLCTFETSADGGTFNALGRPVTAINAQWIGAKFGIFCNAPVGARDFGNADFDWVHLEN